MGRLLSEQEMRTIGLCIIAQSRDGYVTGEGVTQMQFDTAKAQDLKSCSSRDKEWVEWIERYEANWVTPNSNTHCILIPWQLWQERKKGLINDQP